MDENKVKIKRTDTLEEFLRWQFRQCYNSEDFYKIFDEMPLKEIREKCVYMISTESDFGVEWLIQRTNAFFEVADYDTVCMLLERLVIHRGDYQSSIVQLMIRILEIRYHPKIIELLCKKIDHEPSLYNAEVSRIFMKILEEYDSRVIDHKPELVMPVFLTIGKVKDKTFLPLLEKNILDSQRLAHLMYYVSVCQDAITLEGLRMLLIRYLREI